MLKRKTYKGQILLNKSKLWHPARLEIKETGSSRVDFLCHYKEIDDYEDVFHAKFTGLNNCSLLKCHKVGESNGEGGTYFTFEPETILSGGLLSKSEDKDFIGAVVDISAYANWYGKRHFSSVFDETPTIEVHSVSDFHLNVPGAKDSYIRLGHQNNWRNDGFNTTRKVTFYIEYEDEFQISHFIQIKHRLKQILTLLSGLDYRIFLSHLTYRDEKDDRKIKQVMCHKKEQGGESLLTSFSASDIKDVETLLPVYVGKWLTHPHLGGIGDLLFSRYVSKIRDPEMDFLNSCIALESLHRKLFDYNVMEEEIYKEHLQTLDQKGLDAEFLSLLKIKAKYGFQPSLKDRLLDFLDRTSEGSNMDQSFLSDVAFVRNHLVHRTKKTKRVESFNFDIATNRLDNFLKDIILGYLRNTSF